MSGGDDEQQNQRESESGSDLHGLLPRKLLKSTASASSLT
jgi:hypothetical protein